MEVEVWLFILMLTPSAILLKETGTGYWLFFVVDALYVLDMFTILTLATTTFMVTMYVVVLYLINFDRDAEQISECSEILHTPKDTASPWLVRGYI